VSPPDLVVQSFTLVDSPAGELYIGRPVHVQASVTNSGGGVAHYFTYGLKMAREDAGGNPGVITLNSPDLAHQAPLCLQNADCTGAFAGAICGPNQSNPDFNPDYAPGDCEISCTKDADCPAGTGLKCDVDFAGGWCTNYLQPGETKVIDLIGNLPDRDRIGSFPVDKPFPCWVGVFADSWNTIQNEPNEANNIVQNKADNDHAFTCRAPPP